ncbi:hypothetical protein HY994_04920 [Candidatus Micrarchaeota archaeon]|nr:hypothetical protein [Candidatus Micrarchaeota archaeon]
MSEDEKGGLNRSETKYVAELKAIADGQRPTEGKRPIKSYQFRFMPQNVKLDVSVWEGREKDGKAFPSSLSMRVHPDGADPVPVYLDMDDAFQLSALLNRYATDVMEFDAHRRLEAWKGRQQVQLKPVPA